MEGSGYITDKCKCSVTLSDKHVTFKINNKNTKVFTNYNIIENNLDYIQYLGFDKNNDNLIITVFKKLDVITLSDIEETFAIFIYQNFKNQNEVFKN